MRVLILLYFICNCLCVVNVSSTELRSQIENDFRINQITFTGNNFFSAKILNHKFNYSVDEIYDWSDILTIKNELLKLYQAQGFFNVQIEITPLNVIIKKDKVISDINFIIKENQRSLIRKLIFQGNKNIKLLQLMEIVSGNFLVSPTDISGYGYFDQEQLDNYQTQILSFYHSKGFLDVDVVLKKIALHSDLNEVDVAFEIKEGEAYLLEDLSFSGDLENQVFSKNSISVKQGQVLNLIVLQKEVDLLLNPFREEGYIFAKATPQVQIIKTADDDYDFGIVSVNYEIKKGPRVKMNQFLVEGNSKTSNKVILNKVVSDAEKWCRLSVLQKLQESLIRLSYFKTVDIMLQPTNIADEVDVLIKVEEHPTWIFSLAPMLSNETGFVFAGMVADRNWLGFGWLLSLSTELSSLTKTFNFTFFEPNLFSSNQSISFALYRNRLNYPLFVDKNYGINLQYKLRLYDYFTIGFAWQLANVDISEVRSDLSINSEVFWPHNDLKNVVGGYFGAEFNKKSFAVKSELKANYSSKSIGSELNFFELVFNANAYFLMMNYLKVKASVSIGQLFTVCQNLLPISERYYLGGQGSVRGFLPHSLGPMIGGTFKYEQTVEVEFPVWPRYELQGYLFVDAGNAFLSATNFNILQLYWSVGAGLVLPVFGFPMNLELSVPLVKSGHNKSYDLFLGFKSEW